MHIFQFIYELYHSIHAQDLEPNIIIGYNIAMTIYRWSFAEPFQMGATDIMSLVKHMKAERPTEVHEGAEDFVTPPLFDGVQILNTIRSSRAGEGIIGKLTIRNRATTKPFLVVRDYKEMDEHYGPETVKLINRDNPLAAIIQGDGDRRILVHSVVAYSPKGEQEGFWQRRR